MTVEAINLFSRPAGTGSFALPDDIGLAELVLPEIFFQRHAPGRERTFDAVGRFENAMSPAPRLASSVVDSIVASCVPKAPDASPETVPVRPAAAPEQRVGELKAVAVEVKTVVSAETSMSIPAEMPAAVSAEAKIAVLPEAKSAVSADAKVVAENRPAAETIAGPKVMFETAVAVEWHIEEPAAVPAEAMASAPVSAPVEKPVAAPVEAKPVVSVEANAYARVEAPAAAPVEAKPAVSAEAGPAMPVEAKTVVSVEAKPESPAEAKKAIAPVEAKTEEKSVAVSAHVVVAPAAVGSPLPQTVQEAPEVAAASAVSARTEAIVETVNQVVEAVAGRILVTPGIVHGDCEVKILLKPTVLDGSEITMSSSGGALVVSISPATEAAGAMASAALPRLETALAEHVAAFRQVSVALVTKKGNRNETV